MAKRRVRPQTRDTEGHSVGPDFLQLFYDCGPGQ